MLTNPVAGTAQIPNGRNPPIYRLAGFDGYGISLDGRAWCNIPMGKKDGRPPTEWREVKGRPAGYMGYLQINIRKDGKSFYRYIHELVLVAAKGCRPSQSHEVRHLDGDHLNNDQGNLEWGTKAENEKDRIAHGTTAKGERNPSAKLKDEDIPIICLRAVFGESWRSIGKDYSVSGGTIGEIIKGETWTHVPRP